VISIVIMIMLHLDPINKVLVMAGAAAAVALTILAVVCFVGEGCLVYELRGGKTKRKRKVKEYGSAGLNKLSLAEQKVAPTRKQKTQPLVTESINEKVERSFLSRLSSRSQADSTYSSMSSGRTSPSSTICTEEKTSSPSVTFSLLVTKCSTSSIAKLVMTVESASDLPGREYGAHCDPWVSLTLVKDRRTIRGRTTTPLVFFRTKTIRHAHNPLYGQIFVTDIEKSDVKDLVLVVAVMDQDRHSGAVEIGHTMLTLKEANQLLENPEKFTATQKLNKKKKEAGDLLLGLSYLPTAQRLSFSLVKTTNIKVVCGSDEKINPYLRIMMFSHSGRMLKKKKTTVRLDTRDPVFNETLNFEVTPDHLENLRFLILLCNRKQEPDLNSLDLTQYESLDHESDAFYERRGSQGKQKDVCLGRLTMGWNVIDGKVREQYREVISCPRQVVSMWHTLG